MPRRTTSSAAAQLDSDRQPIDQNATAVETQDIAIAAQPPAASSAGPATSAATPKILTGKLASVVEQISQADGATIADLTATSGWQPHTIRAALSRLRRRGHIIILSTRADGRKAYRLQHEGCPC